MLSKTCPVCNQKSLSFDDDYVFCTKCSIYKVRHNLVQKMIYWSRSRYIWWRLPIFVWFVTVLVDNIRDPMYNLYRMSNPLSALNMGMHELGHFLFMAFGEFMHILGGSLMQILFPILGIIGFIQKKWYFAASLSFCWLGLSLFDVATYVADARTRELPLAMGPGVFGIDATNLEAAYDRGHDWYQLLSRTGNLSSDLAIAHGLRVAATIFFVLGLLLAGFMLLQMLVGSIQRIKSQNN